MINVVKGGLQYLSNLQPNEKKSIMEDLTLKNPAYVQAKAYGRGRYTNIPQYLMFYQRVGQDLIVPRGYNLKFEHKVISDERVERKVLYPKFQLQLRTTQKEAYEAWTKNRDKSMLVLPTGKGKSILGCYMAYATRQRTLVVVQKDDLIDGWMNDFALCFGLKKGEKIGVIKAKKFKIGSQITLATIQTLAKMDEEKKMQLYDKFGMVILDECLVGDTMITLKDGGFKFIKDIKNSDKLVGGKVSNKFSRKSKICELVSKHSTIRGSYTHPTFVLPKLKVKAGTTNKFTQDDLEVKCLKDIEVGDYVPVLKKVPHTTKNSWTKEQLSFVALIMADGHLDKEGNRVKVNVSKDLEWYREIFNNGVKSFGDYEVKESFDCRGNLTLWTTSKELKSLLEAKFSIPRGKKSNNIIINSEIQYAPLESIKAFIETLLNCEGYLNLTGKSYRVGIDMTSRDFIYGLSHLLKKFEIITSMQEIKRANKNHATSYRLYIGGEDLNKFFSSFKLLDRKTPKEPNLGGFNGYDLGDYRLVRVNKVNLTDDVEEVYDYTTTSHKFIANGLLTHNCHHSVAKSYEIFKRFNCKHLIGLTATDELKGGLRPVQYWIIGEVGYRCKESEDDEDIMPYSVIIRKSKLEFDPPPMYYYGRKVVDADEAELLKEAGKKVKRKPLDPQELKALLKDPDFNLQVAYDIKREYEARKSCIAFLHEKEHIRYLKDILIKIGVPESQIQLYYGDSKTPDSVMKERAESKEVLITIATFSKATEGTNVKAWERAFLVTSINDPKNTKQAVGRIRRRKEGKVDAIVYDYVHPKVKGMSNHIKTRMTAYKDNKAKIIGYNLDTKKPAPLTRGFRH